MSTPLFALAAPDIAAGDDDLNAAGDEVRLERKVRAHIIAALATFKGLTITMMTPRVRYVYPKGWRRILERMVEEGIVERRVETNPAAPSRMITRHYLSPAAQAEADANADQTQ